MPTRFLFFSDGGERYWETKNQLHTGDFEYRYLPGVYIAPKLRLVPSLVWEILTSPAEAVVMCMAGRFALPMSYLASRIARKPFILWTGLWYHPQSFFHRLSWPLTLWIYRHSDAILVYGEHVRQFLLEHGVESERIFHFWHSVDTVALGREVDEAKVAALKLRWKASNRPVILSVGRLDPVKSLDTLMRASAEIQESHPHQLVIVGRGPERERLEALATELSASVVFENYIPNPELPEVYAAAEVFCLPSETLPTVKEAWGLVLNEAMLQRCIPVASDAVGAAVGGLFPEAMRGLVFHERDRADLERALREALDRSKKPSERQASRDQALMFSPKRQAQGLLNAMAYLRKKRGKA